MGTRVRAIITGFANGQRRRVGTEFTLPDGMKPGKWMEVLGEDVPAKSKDETEADAKKVKEAAEKEHRKAVALANASNRNLSTEQVEVLGNGSIAVLSTEQVAVLPVEPAAPIKRTPVHKD